MAPQVHKSLRSQCATSKARVAMNKLKLISELSKSNGLSTAESQQVVELFFDAMGNALARGERVEIRGFCIFHIKEYKAYTGRNPKTGERVTVKPKRLPFFKPGADLKNRVDL